jgi:GTP-binding protein
LEPALGTIHRDDRQLVIADIPGLIEGASAGAGLGHDFLAHVERTRLLVHVLDLAPLDGSDPATNFDTVETELRLHDPRLAALPRMLALSKADLVTPEQAHDAQAEWQRRLGEEVPVLVTSSATFIGLEQLVAELLRRVPLQRPDEAAGQRTGGGDEALKDLPEHRVFRPRSSTSFEVAPSDEGGFVVSGDAVEKLVARYDLDNEDAMAHLERRLRGMGVIRALQDAGFAAGDDVEIAGVVFELDP